MAFSEYSTLVLLCEIYQNVSAHGVRSTTPFDVGRVQAASMSSLKRCNGISMSKVLSTSTWGALTARMSGQPKMLLEPVKNTLLNQALSRSRGGFSSKMHLVTDGNGLSLGFYLAPG
jgi:hypothetical protein